MSQKGKMTITNDSVGGSVEILNRPPYEGVPMTLDDTLFATDDVVKAGALITKDGKTAESGTGAVGILLWDVYKDAPQGLRRNSR